jgi:hypothetical protein
MGLSYHNSARRVLAWARGQTLDAVLAVAVLPPVAVRRAMERAGLDAPPRMAAPG